MSLDPPSPDLTSLLEPRSIAVVGANDRPGSYADIVLRNLARAGFDGDVWGVNPRREKVHGRPCVPAVSDLPEPVDAVVVAIPAAGVPGVISDIVTRGCGGAIVISAGFGEIPEGRELERDLREAAAAGLLPVCGPNGNGIVAVNSRAPMWGDSVAPLEPGPVALISQSGNLAVNALGSRRGIRYHTVVSSGNQAALDASEWLAAICELEGIGSVAMFLEEDGDGARLAEALATCAERGIGVAVLKVGESEAGARAASSHTGAVAGDVRVFRSLIEEAGGAWARDPHELLELARVLAEPRARPRGDGGLAILTCSGGDSSIAADEAERLGTRLPQLGDSTRDRLAKLLPAAATVGNPLDYTAMIWGDTDLLRRITVAVGDDPAVDQLLILYDHPRGLAPEAAAEWAAVRAGIVAGADETEAATLVASTLPDLIDDEASGELASRGVPAIAGLATAIRCALALRRPAADPHRLREIAAAARIAGGHADAVRGTADGDGWLDEIDAKDLLRSAGLPVPPGVAVADEDECARAVDELGGPVAIKIASPTLRHKSDAGALRLDVEDSAAARDAYRELRAGSEVGGRILVERMMPPGVELLVAARADAVVPVLVIGIGGIWTEALDDIAIVPLPADAERVTRAIRSLRGAGSLLGSRGADAVDFGAAAALSAGVGELLLDSGLDLLELNPVAVHASGCVALDALANRRLTPPHTIGVPSAESVREARRARAGPHR
ncbi:MAG TPA: acetate--CoA ligase family protein [Solirubrobacterales bacterium]|nr:acetate--CoA ligase family protein [Solirubrobacterales bacterium]